MIVPDLGFLLGTNKESALHEVSHSMGADSFSGWFFELVTTKFYEAL
jgi:hypothetical protein